MRDRPSVTLPSAMYSDRRLEPTDLLIAWGLAAAIPEGDDAIMTDDPRLVAFSRFKLRAITESLVRLRDAGWVCIAQIPRVGRGPGMPPRRVTPLWRFQDDAAEGGRT